MVLNWNNIEVYDTTTSTWVNIDTKLEGTHTLDETNEVLDGDENFSFNIRNNTVNRAYVAVDRTARLKYDSKVIFVGVLSAIDYTKNKLTCTVYNEVYEKLKKVALSNIYVDAAPSTIFAAICLLAGVTAGVCPSTPTLTRQFKYANGYTVIKFLSKVTAKNYYVSDDGVTLNIGVRDSCILALPMNEGTGATAADKSGFGNDGTITGASWVDGKYGKALSFNGSTDYISCGDFPDLDAKSSFTWAAWIYADSFPDWARIFDYTYDVDNRIGFGVRSSGKLFLEMVSGGSLIGGVNPADKILLADTWYHVAVVVNGDTVTLYVDGIAEPTTGTVSGSWTGWTGVLSIGRYGGAAAYFDGILDEAHIYNRALSPDEIQFLYNEEIENSSPRTVNRTKKRDKVIYTGQDDTGAEIEGVAGTGNDVAVFKEAAPTDAATLTLLATDKLTELNTDDSEINLNLSIKHAAHLRPGDAVSMHKPELALDDIYRLASINKKLYFATVELNRHIKTQAELLSELDSFTSEGILSFSLSPSDDLRHSNDTEKYSDDTTQWVKIKEIKCDVPIPGAIRIKLDSKYILTGTYVTPYDDPLIKLCKNGVDIIPEFAPTDTYATTSLDFGSFDKDDTIEIWVRSQYGNVPPYEWSFIVYAQNFRLYYTPDEASVTFTDQDPA